MKALAAVSMAGSRHSRPAIAVVRSHTCAGTHATDARTGGRYHDDGNALQAFTSRCELRQVRAASVQNSDAPFSPSQCRDPARRQLSLDLVIGRYFLCQGGKVTP